MRAVEVGSGKGYLLAVLKQLGWDVYGIEIAEAAAKHAEDTFEVDSFIGKIEDYLQSDERSAPFSLVLGIDIIEHVTDPERFVQSLAQLTTKGGTLIIDTPNGGAKHIDIEGENWRGFNPFHIYLFNNKNLKILLERNGFKVTQSFTYNNFENRRKGAFSYARSVVDRVLLRQDAPEAKLLADCVIAARNAKNYWQTEDARGELAQGCRGENLIVFAKYIDSMENINLKGIMVLPSLGENNKKQMQDSKLLHEELVSVFPHAEFLSMGTTNDFETAIVSGSNMIRIGELIFGKR